MSINYTFNDHPDRVSFLEPGEYIASVKEFAFGISQKGDNKLDLTLDVGGKCTIYDTVIFTESAGWKFDQVLKCFTPNKEGGEVPPKGEAVEINDEFMNKNVLGAKGWISTMVDTWNEKKRSKVQNYISASTKPLNPANKEESKNEESNSGDPDW